MVTTVAYLAFTAFIAAILGAGIAFGLVPLARRLGMWPLQRALIVYASIPVGGLLVGIAATLAMSFLAPGGGPGGPGAGQGIAEIFTAGAVAAFGMALGWLLAIGRVSVRAMALLVVLSISAAWWLAGIETFWLCDLIVGLMVLHPLGLPHLDSSIYSAMHSHLSAIIFAVVSTACVLKPTRRLDLSRDGEHSPLRRS